MAYGKLVGIGRVAGLPWNDDHAKSPAKQRGEH
jgi:hypothetical protein